MKVLYIISLVLVPVFGITIIYYMAEYMTARRNALWSDYMYSSYSDYAYLDIATEGSSVFLLFIVFFILLFSFTIKNVKTTTAKVMSIIGLCFSGIAFLVSIFGAASPYDADFDGVSALNFLYCIILLAFCIVNLVQSFRKMPGTKTSSEVLIDDL